MQTVRSLKRLRNYPAPVRILAFCLILLLLWLPLAIPVYWLIRDRNLASILTLVILYTQFIWFTQYWGQQVHRQPQVLRSYGLQFSRRNGLYLLRGFGFGLLSVVAVLGLETIVGWLQWQMPQSEIIRISVEGLAVSLALGTAEELFFRGWLLDELQRDYAPMLALWVNAILFAALHFKLRTFPALMLLGIALVWAKRSHSETHLGRRYFLLGLPIGLHAGLVYGNYVVEVGKLIQYTDRVPTWMTGIDRNPVAGLAGICLMAALAVGMKKYANYHSNYYHSNYYSRASRFKR